MDMQGKQYEVGGRSAKLILAILLLLYLVNWADRSVLAAVLEPMKIDLGLTDTQAGLIQSVFLLGVGLFMFPVAIVVERWSRRKAIGLMAIIWSFATFATGLGRNFTQVFITRAAVGIGEAGFATGGVGWLSFAFPKEVRARIVGIFNIGIPIGSAIGLLVGGFIATQTGDWRMAFYVFAIPGIILGIITFFLPDYAILKEQETGTDSGFYKNLFRMFKVRSYVLNIIACCLWMFLGFAMMGWTPALLIRAYGMTPALAGFIGGAIGLMAIVGAPMGGFLADVMQKRYRSGRVLYMAIAVILWVLLTLAFIMAIGLPIPILFTIGVFQGLVSASLSPISQVLWSDVLPARFRNSGFGMAACISFLGGAMWGPYVTGAISDALGGGAEGLKTAFYFMLPIALLAALFYFIAMKYYPADSEKVSDIVMSEK